VGRAAGGPSAGVRDDRGRRVHGNARVSGGLVDDALSAAPSVAAASGAPSVAASASVAPSALASAGGSAEQMSTLPTMHPPSYEGVLQAGAVAASPPAPSANSAARERRLTDHRPRIDTAVASFPSTATDTGEPSHTAGSKATRRNAQAVPRHHRRRVHRGFSYRPPFLFEYPRPRAQVIVPPQCARLRRAPASASDDTTTSSVLTYASTSTRSSQAC
jgi:hypothetical protein